MLNLKYLILLILLKKENLFSSILLCMDYIFLGVCLDNKKRRDFKKCIEVELVLKSAVGIDRACEFSEDLVSFLTKEKSEGGFNKREKMLESWLLNHGTPYLIKYMVDNLTTCANSKALVALRYSNPQWILPREHVWPSFQVAKIRSPLQSVLVCFTGNALKLNMPVQLFHLIAAKYFDMLIYLRDDSRQRFTQGIKGIEHSLDGLCDFTFSKIPKGCDISVIGASGGGMAATYFAEYKKVKKIALFSPPFKFKEISAIEGKTNLDYSGIRLYFGKDSEIDQKLLVPWLSTDYSENIIFLNTDSHGTLGFLFQSNKLDGLLKWLSCK